MHADHGHALAASLQQIRRGALGTFHVFRGDMVHLVGEDAFADKHQRIVHIQLVDIILIKFQWTVDQAVDHRLLGAVQRLNLAFARVLRRLDDHAQAQLLGLFDDQRRKLREVRHLQIGNGEADDAGLSPAQIARGHVQRVAELVDGLVDLVSRGLRHELVVVDHIRHRFDRYAGRLRDLAHGHHVLAVGAILLRHVNPFSPKTSHTFGPNTGFRPLQR